MSAREMSGAEALLRALRAMGVERIFASPGSDWAPLWEALAAPHGADEFPLYVSSRHEETAAAMALGYARASGKLPALVLHTTVGSQHAAMLLRSALHERVPMVVLAGESIGFSEPPAPVLGRQWLRLLTDVGGPARLMQSCTKWSFGLNAAGILPHTIQRACQIALAAPRGPVFVSVPTEFMLESSSAPAPAAALPAAAVPEGAALEALARALAEAKQPVIITEESGRDLRAVEELVALAELLGAPVLEAWQPYYVNFPRRHPLYGGVVTDEMAARVGEADAVLLVESVAPWHPASALPGPGTKVYALGEDPLHVQLPFWGYRTDLLLGGAVAPTLAALRAILQRRIAPGSRVASIDLWRRKHEAGRAVLREQAREAGTQPILHTRWIAQQLNELLPAGAIVVDETITHRLDLLRLLDRLEPGGYFEASYGGLGGGLGMALGVKHAHPQRTVILTIGDGAFHYNPVLASLGAAQELKLPILVLLFDNAGYLSQKTDVANYYPQGEAVRSGNFAGTSILPRPDYAALARACGGHGEATDDPAQLRAALERGLAAVAAGRLALLDLQLAPVKS